MLLVLLPWCLVVPLYGSVVVIQGRHTKTGQLAAIKVMKVNEVRTIPINTFDSSLIMYLFYIQLHSMICSTSY